MNLNIVEYITRDTISNNIIDSIVAKIKDGKLKAQIDKEVEVLKSKKEGSYKTLKSSFSFFCEEISKMMSYYKSAVLEYYARQTREFWAEKIPTKLLKECDNEIKTQVSFIKYNYKGYPTSETNSITSLTETKQFNKFLKDVEENCFIDNEYIFPDSEHFKKLEKEKGRAEAKRQVFYELKNKIDLSINKNI